VWHTGGALGLTVALAIDVLGGILIGTGAGRDPARLVLGILLLGIGSVLMSGLTTVQPGQTVEVLLFGRPLGQLTASGFVMTIPMTRRRSIR